MAPADEVLKNKEEIGRALKAIAEGHPVEGREGRFIHVNGFTIDISPILDVLKSMGAMI